MKIRSQSSSSLKPLLTIIGVLVLALLGWLYYTHHYQKWPFLPAQTTEKPANTVDYNEPTKDQAASGSSIKEQVAEQAKNSSEQTPSASTSSPQSVTMDITAANKNGDTLMVRTLIQKVTSTGTCALSMTGPNGATYSANAGVQAMASTSTCQGFNIPTGNLAHGAWRINIDFKDGLDTANASKEVTL